MRRIGRYSIGVGGGVLVLATVGGSAWQEATQLAGAAVGLGWLVWGVMALRDEFGTAAGGAARFAFDAAGALFNRRSAGAQDELNDDESDGGETLPAARPTRWVRLNDRNGTRWLALDGPQDTPYRRRLQSFLALGERLGSFKVERHASACPERWRTD